MDFEGVEFVQVDFVTLNGLELKVEGGIWNETTDTSEKDWLQDLNLVCSDGADTIKAQPVFTGEKICKKITIADRKSEFEYRRFACTVSLPRLYDCRVAWEMAGKRVPWQAFRHGWFSPFSEGVGFGYAIQSERMIELSAGDLTVRRYSALRHACAELRFCILLLCRFSFESFTAVVCRTMVMIGRCFKRRPLWLFSDRFNKADDNGRALFEYVNSLGKDKCAIDSVFAVESTSPDFRDMKRTGRVVNAAGLAYKIKFLLSDFVISAYHTRAQRMPFSDVGVANMKPFCNNPKFVYLRHGVSMNDVSKIVGRQFDNARIMISSAPREYQSVLADDYGYTEREVKLCGLARYDKLYDDAKGRITFMPTWRKTIAHRAGAYKFRLSRDFAESRFFLAYRALLTHPLVVDACRRHHLVMQIMLHPNIVEARRFFATIPDVEVLPLGESYRKVFAESNLLITDYSSVAFDFAYLYKPVLYYQFDQEEFFGGQYNHGYYDYGKDGFGEVETDLDAMATCIAGYVENGCQMKPEFKKRVDDFFAFTDKNNCKRIYDAILEASREESSGAGNA